MMNDKPSIDIPAWIHFLNRHARQVIFDVERIRQLLFSRQWYLSGAFSLIDRRKKPFHKEFIFIQINLIFILLYKLHKSQHQNEYLMLMHHKQDMVISCINLRFLVQWILELVWKKKERRRWQTMRFHSNEKTFFKSTILTLSSWTFCYWTRKIFLTFIFFLCIACWNRTKKKFLNLNTFISKFKSFKSYFACFTCYCSKNESMIKESRN